MVEPENRIFCRLDGLTTAAREQKRLAALRKLGLLQAETVPVFDEATQAAADFLDVPICILSIMTSDQQLIKSAVGLSRIGLMNELAQLRQLSRNQGFCTYVVDSHQILAIHDTANNPVFTNSTLVSDYGICAYLGAPLLTAEGQCVGTLAVMDIIPRQFTHKDRQFLAITARWSLSEFERDHLLKQEDKNPNQWQIKVSSTPLPDPVLAQEPTSSSCELVPDLSAQLSSINLLKLKLLTELTHELRRPLTSIMGMASVLNRQIYGPLTSKQQEYLEIIHHSGQHLVCLIEEIVTLGILDQTSEKINLTSVDIAMLCQQAINSLDVITQQHQQEIRLSVEPGIRIWMLDKEKVRQIIYYLLLSQIKYAVAGSEIRIHVSRKSDLENELVTYLQIGVWTSHPWLGDGISQMYGDITDLSFPLQLNHSSVFNALELPLNTGDTELGEFAGSTYPMPCPTRVDHDPVSPALNMSWVEDQTAISNDCRGSLGLLLSCQLAELHGGKISVQGLSESGYRYVIYLPQLQLADE